MVAKRRTRNTLHLARAVHQASRPGGPGLWTRLRAVPRLVRSVRRGEYTGLSSARLAMLLAGVGYVLSPVDVVPEAFLLVLGLADDLLVIGWVAATLVRETEDFLAWEQAAGASWARQSGWAEHAQWARPEPPPPGQTVPSYVVPD